MNTEEAIRTTADMDRAELHSASRRIRIDSNLVQAPFEGLIKTIVLAVCGWSLIEAPFEIGVSSVDPHALAVVLSKLVLVVAGLAAIFNARFARAIFSFICGASVLAIVPALPLEYTRSVAIGLFSTVECVGKAAYVIVLCIASLRETTSRQSSNVTGTAHTVSEDIPT